MTPSPPLRAPPFPFPPRPTPLLPSPGQSKHQSLRQGRLLSKPPKPHTVRCGCCQDLGAQMPVRGGGVQAPAQNWAFCKERAGSAWISHEAPTSGSRG